MTGRPGRSASRPAGPPGRMLPADTIMSAGHRAWGQILPFRRDVVRRCAISPEPATTTSSILEYGASRGAAPVAGAGSAEAAEVQALAVSRIKTSSTTTADSANATRQALIRLPLLGLVPGVPLTGAADYLCSRFILHLVEGGHQLVARIVGDDRGQVSGGRRWRRQPRGDDRHDVSPRARFSAIDTTGAEPATGRIWRVNWPSWRGQQGSPVKSRGHRSHITGSIGGGRHG